MIGKDSEDDVVNSETESETEEDVKGIVDLVRDSVSPPVTEEELIGKWYAVIVRLKRRKTLHTNIYRYINTLPRSCSVT